MAAHQREPPTFSLSHLPTFPLSHFPTCSLSFLPPLGLKRQFNGEPAAFPDLALHAHPPAVGFDDVLHDAQPDADALRLAAQLGAASIEAFEDALVFLRRDAGTVVLDGY